MNTHVIKVSTIFVLRMNFNTRISKRRLYHHVQVQGNVQANLMSIEI